ncbi:MAG TPA: hypothetical protein VNZ94_08240 [Xanthobacteraceae bacterium]|nr:hypothetical protein [Xanthobacteraceae bacterium]
MSRSLKALTLAGACLLLAAGTAAADTYKLGNNQRLLCSRGLSAGKMSTVSCSSYAYLFNTKTSEFFRCRVSLTMRRDNKAIRDVQAEGSCAKRPRIFEEDSDYTFEASETEPPNTNSFFGEGGYSVWVADTDKRRVRGCLSFASGLGSDVSKCIDMTFQ